MSLLGLDVGTTMCKAAAFSVDGRLLALSSREYRTRHPHPGYAELDATEVWGKIKETLSDVAATTKGDPISALSVSSMGEAVVPLSRSRRILGDSILCADTRGAEHADTLRAAFGEERLYRINPNIIGPQYSMPKILWIKEHQPELFKKTELFLHWADAVGFLLGADPYASNSLANRTLLFDLDANDWSDELLSWSGLARSLFGRVVPGGAVVGSVSDTVADELGLPRGVAIVAGGHDQCCNALGCGAVAAGKMVCGIGTYECVTPTFHKPGNLTAMRAQGLNIEHHVAPEVFVSFLFNQAGSLVRWFRDTFAAAETDQGGDIFDRLNKELPTEPSSLLVLPHFDPLLWPKSVTDSSGVILGLKTRTTRGEILKAIMEGATFYFVEGIQTLRDNGVEMDECIASGGGSKSDAWLQIKADIFGLPFVRPLVAEAGVAGAAMLAGISTRIFSTPEEAARIFVKREKTFEPDPRRHAAYHERHELFRSLFPALQPILRKL